MILRICLADKGARGWWKLLRIEGQGASSTNGNSDDPDLITRDGMLDVARD